jgi:MFS family permease
VQDTYVIAASAALLGLSLGTFFPVTLAMIGETLTPSEMHGGSGLFTAAFSYGCVAGPVCSALLMSRFGDSQIFTLILIMLILLILRMRPKRLLFSRAHDRGR